MADPSPARTLRHLPGLVTGILPGLFVGVEEERLGMYRIPPGRS